MWPSCIKLPVSWTMVGRRSKTIASEDWRTPNLWRRRIWEFSWVLKTTTDALYQDKAQIAVPLTEATRKQASDKIEWTTERLAAFQQIKTSLTEGSVVVIPDEEKPFLLYTAIWSRYKWCLQSREVDGIDRPVAYYSHKLKPAEMRCTITEQECLAVVEAMKHIWVYLSWAIFTIITDHRRLKHLAKVKDENRRLARWSLALQPYIYEVLLTWSTEQRCRWDVSTILAIGQATPAVNSWRTRKECRSWLAMNLFSKLILQDPGSSQIKGVVQCPVVWVHLNTYQLLLFSINDKFTYNIVSVER